MLPFAVLCAVAGIAAFLRLYRLGGVITLYPDSYAQLRAVENLLSGNFPLSYHYPPGIALIMAPAFLVFPDSLATMQGVIVAAGLALVALAYGWLYQLTKDRGAAALFAAAVAFGAPFVYFSRIVWFDGVNTFLIALTLFLAPHVVRRGALALAAYGVLVFAMATVRHTNVIALPALLIASSQPYELSARGLLAHARSRPVAIVGAVVAVLFLGHLALAGESLGRFSNSNGGSIFEMASYPSRLGQYVQASLIGYHERWGWPEVFAAITIVSLAIAGAQRLWHLRRRTTAALVTLSLLWLPVHATYRIFDDRYALPVFFFVLMFAAFGLSVALQRWRRLSKPWQRVGAAFVLAMGVSTFASVHAARDYTQLLDWPAQVAAGREQAYGPIRDALRDIDGPAVLISSQALAVDRANPGIETYDLIPYAGTHGINEASAEALAAYVREQQAAGRTVYYHYTEYEDVGATFRLYELGFDAFFAALQRDFSLTELASASERPQRLYLVERR